jgi:low affinity Fe/Cu permease
MQTPNFDRLFSKASDSTANTAGRPLTFSLSAALVIVWMLSGPLFRFSDTWQLVMNTTSSIVTFLMVFVIQNAQNRDSAALQMKLDELIRATKARNDLIGIEDRSQIELEDKKQRLASDDLNQQSEKHGSDAHD